MKLTLEESQAVVAFNESHLDAQKYPIGEAADLLARDLMKALPGRFKSVTECSKHLLEYLSAGQEIPDGEFFTEAANTVKAHEENRNSAVEKGKRPPSFTTEKLEEVAGNKKEPKRAGFRKWSFKELDAGDSVSPVVELTEPERAGYRELTTEEMAPREPGRAVNPTVASKPVSTPEIYQLQSPGPVPQVAGKRELTSAEKGNGLEHKK